MHRLLACSKKPCFSCFILLGLWCLLACPAFAVSDFQWTFNNNSLFSWELTSAASVSTTSLNAGPFPAQNPTINLVVGKRYEVTIVDPLGHPWQILAKGPDFSSDIILLSYGSTLGSKEGDAGVNWTDDGATVNAKVTFTMTQALLNAMLDNTGGITRTPGYRCGVHVTIMRGDFQIPIPPPAEAAAKFWEQY